MRAMMNLLADPGLHVIGLIIVLVIFTLAS